MEDVIRRAQRGDQEAFQRLVESYAEVVWRTALVLLPSRTLAEQAIQEGWLDVWRGLSRYQPHRPFRPWLLTVIANRCRMEARNHDPIFVPLDGIDQSTGSDPVAEQILQQELDTELHAIITTLPSEQQQVLELRYFAGLDLAEVALLLHIPLGTVKSRSHRGLQAIKAQLTALPSDRDFSEVL